MRKAVIEYIIFLVIGIVIYVSVKLIKHNLVHLGQIYDVDMLPFDEAIALIAGAFLTGWCVGKTFKK